MYDHCAVQIENENYQDICQKILQIKLKKKRQDVILTATQCFNKNNVTKQIHTFQFSQGQSVLHQQWKEPETLSTSNKWAAYHQLLRFQKQIFQLRNDSKHRMF